MATPTNKDPVPTSSFKASLNKLVAVEDALFKAQFSLVLGGLVKVSNLWLKNLPDSPKNRECILEVIKGNITFLQDRLPKVEKALSISTHDFTINTAKEQLPDLRSSLEELTARYEAILSAQVALATSSQSQAATDLDSRAISPVPYQNQE